jgi:hypothetical protein
MDEVEYDVDDVDAIQKLARTCTKLLIHDAWFIKVNNYCICCGHQAIDTPFCCTWCKFRYWEDYGLI